MSYRVVVRGDNPSGKVLAVLCARTGGTMDNVRSRIASPSGFMLRSGLSLQSATSLKDDIPDDGSAVASVEPDGQASVVVLVGYRPGSRGRLRSAIQRMSRLSTEEVIQFLSSIPIALKSNTDIETAQAIKEMLEREGGIVEIRSSADIPGYSMLRKPFARLGRVFPANTCPPHADEGTAAGAALGEGSISSAPEPPPSPPVHIPDAPSEETVFRKPPRIAFYPPEFSLEAVPPAVLNRLPSAVFEAPRRVRFTIPAAMIPPAVPGRPQAKAPERISRQDVYPLYIYPVDPLHREEAVSVICSKIGVSPGAAGDKVEHAPCLLCFYSERINALVKLRELSEAGIPVSLIPCTSRVSPERTQGVFPGWLHGKR